LTGDGDRIGRPEIAPWAWLDAVPMADADFEQALIRTNEIERSTAGRTAGRAIAHPVWFVRQGEQFHLLPMEASDSSWHKNVLKTPMIRLAAGRPRTARATPSTDPTTVRAVVERFSAKYGPEYVQPYAQKPNVAVEVALA
jgi:F420H(2)-dependent quinone reductase